MRDLRCRWCAAWLLPSRVGDGYPYCDDVCAAASLDYRWSCPSFHTASTTHPDHVERHGAAGRSTR